MDSELLTAIKELVELNKQRMKAQAEFEEMILEEMRRLNRTLGSMQARQTVGDL